MKSKPTKSRIAQLEGDLRDEHCRAEKLSLDNQLISGDVRRLQDQRDQAVKEGQAHIDRLQKELSEKEKGCATCRDVLDFVQRQYNDAVTELKSLRNEMASTLKPKWWAKGFWPWLWKSVSLSESCAWFFFAVSIGTILAGFMVGPELKQKQDEILRAVRELKAPVTNVITGQWGGGQWGVTNDATLRGLNPIPVLHDDRWKIVTNGYVFHQHMTN